VKVPSSKVNSNVEFTRLIWIYSTLFHGDTWPLMEDSADHLQGWSLPEVHKQRAGPAPNDLYGKLHCYLHEKLSLFRQRLRAGSSCNFKLFNMDAKVLAEHLGGAVAFDRIEVL
jgi:hypothetical protein